MVYGVEVGLGDRFEILINDGTMEGRGPVKDIVILRRILQVGKLASTYKVRFTYRGKPHSLDSSEENLECELRKLESGDPNGGS